MNKSRRTFISAVASAAVLPSITFLSRPAHAAEFTYKIGNDLPATHPLHLRMVEAASKIREETNGRFELQVFGNNQLGGDTDMLAQLRSGALEMTSMPDVVLATLNPIASITGVGFAFTKYDDVWRAMDGELGSYIRSKINKSGLLVMDKIWDNGFRQITNNIKPIQTPDDLRNLKIRTPVSPLWMSMFKGIGAAPTALNFSELYSALQTKIVDGQENPLTNIYSGKLYEVQKYCTYSNHVWSGFWMLMNPRKWNALPPSIQEVIARNMNQAAIKQREDVAKMNASLEKDLAEKGVKFNSLNPKLFREALSKAGFYAEWRQKFGPEAWAVLNKYSGELA